MRILLGAPAAGEAEAAAAGEALAVGEAVVAVLVEGAELQLEAARGRPRPTNPNNTSLLLMDLGVYLVDFCRFFLLMIIDDSKIGI